LTNAIQDWKFNAWGEMKWDSAARSAIESYFPDHDVHMITTPTIWYYGGGVHCVANDQPRAIIQP